MRNTKLFRWQKETQIDFVDPTPPLNKTDPPEFIAPISPSKVVIPGRFLPADTAWSPNFKVKVSVGFTPTEHPDRPTLLSELAAERAKEEEEAKSEAAASGKTGRRKNELDSSQMITDPFIAYGLLQAKWINGLKLTDQLVNVIKQQQQGMTSAEARNYILDAEAEDEDDFSGMNDGESSDSDGDKNDKDANKSVGSGSKESSKGRRRTGLRMSGLGKGVLSGKEESVVQKRERRFKDEVARRNDGIKRFSYDSISVSQNGEELKEQFSQALANVQEKQATLASVTSASADGDQNVEDYQSIDPKSLSVHTEYLGMDPPDDDSLGLLSASAVSVAASGQEDKSPTDDFLATIDGGGLEQVGRYNTVAVEEHISAIVSSKDRVPAVGEMQDAVAWYNENDSDKDGKNIIQEQRQQQQQINDDVDIVEQFTTSLSVSQEPSALMNSSTEDYADDDIEDNDDNDNKDEDEDEQRRQRDDKDENLQVLQEPSLTNYTFNDDLDEEEGTEGDEVFKVPITKKSIKINAPMKTVVKDLKGEVIDVFSSQVSGSYETLNVKGSKVARSSSDDVKDEMESLNLSVSRKSEASLASQLQVKYILLDTTSHIHIHPFPIFLLAF